MKGVNTQRFNRCHGMVGHLFQGRYKAVLVQKDAYLQELTRYVALNPLRAQMVERLEDRTWSSYWAMIGEANAPGWLDKNWLLSSLDQIRQQLLLEY